MEKKLKEKNPLEAEVRNSCHVQIAKWQQSNDFNGIHYKQQSGLAFGFSQVQKAMESLPGGRQAFKKLVPTKYGLEGLADELLISFGGWCGQLEYKREKGGRQTEQQKQFQKACDYYQIPYGIIQNSQQLESFLIKNKLLHLRKNGK